MKKALLLWFLIPLFNFLAYAQAPPCGTNDPPGNTCMISTPICNLDGYCGTTDGSYTVDAWGQSGFPFGCGLFGLQPCPGTGLVDAFCGSIENNSFLSFVASEPNISFDVWVYNSSSGYGIQIMIFKPDGNCSGDVTSYYCNGQMSPSPNPQTVSASGLTVGETYYIMIDGYAGDVADYTFSANAGVATPLDLSVGSTASICIGESITVTATGGDENYTWLPSPDLSATTGATVTITPPSAAGDYTYTVTAGGGTSLCPSSNEFTLTLTVENCGCAATASNDNPSFCENAVGTVNLTATGAPGVSYSWSGPNGFTSPSQNPTDVPVPPSPGTYSYTVEVNENGTTCTATTNVVVESSPHADAGSSMQITCDDPAVQLNGSSSTPGVTYSWSGPGIISGAAAATPTVNQAGTYTLTVTNSSNGCTATAVVNVTTDPSSLSASAGPDQTITCTTPSVQLNGSASEQHVSFLWNGPGIVSGETTATPTVNLPGAYTLIVTNPSNGCTATSTVNVTEDSDSFTVSAGTAQTITCTANSVQLNGSSSASGVTYSWAGPGIVSGTATPTPTVNLPGTYILTVTNPSNGCTGTSSVIVSSSSDLPLSGFTADTLTGCEGLVVNFSAHAANNPSWNYQWNFGNGNTGNGASVVYQYNHSGCYAVTLTVTDNTNNCTSSTTLSDSICIIENPAASFSAQPQTIISNSGLTVIHFSNSSSGADQYTWFFEDGSQHSSQNTSFDFNEYEPGDYPVHLIASNQNLCFDSTTVIIRIKDQVIYYVPNTFTPDGDEFNQSFHPVITSGIDIYNFSFQVYNRWGEMIWESKDPSVGWDGTYNGRAVQEGTYSWSMSLKLTDVDDRVRIEGHVNLLR